MSMSPAKTVSLVALGLLVAFGFLLPTFVTSTNCGGNSTALHEIRFVGDYALAELANGKSEPLRWSAETKELLGHILSRGYPYLVRSSLESNLPPKTIVAACVEPFGNVPKPTFWNGHRRNPAHAVSYFDSSFGLISTNEFARLDRSAFVEVSVITKKAGTP